MCPANGLASHVVYRKRFGSFQKLYDLIPYRIPRTFVPQCKAKRSIKLRADLHNQFCNELIDAKLSFAISGHLFTGFNQGMFTLEVGRCVWLRPPRCMRWRVYTRPDAHKYPCVVVRLREDDETVCDYCLLPMIPGTTWWFSVTEKAVRQCGVVRDSALSMVRFIAGKEPN
jgi:hypothetical protein